MSHQYFQEGGVTVYHADVRSAGFTGAALVLADPPYQQTGLAWDRWPAGWPEAVAAAALPSASMFCFGSLRMFLRHRDEFTGQWRVAQERVWEKANGSGPGALDRFLPVHELHVHFTSRGGLWRDVFRSCAALRVPAPTGSLVRNRRRLADQGEHRSGGEYGSRPYIDDGTRLRRSVERHASVRGRGVNETEKPVEFIEPAARYACPPGGVVLVPFAGSGAEVAAALRAGCEVVAYDVREDQCEATALRAQAILAEQKV